MENTLENLTQYIIDKAQAEVQGMMDAARSDAEHALAAATQKYSQMLHAQQGQIAEKNEQAFREAVQLKAVYYKKQRTGYAQNLIEGLFEEAYHRLCEMPAEDFIHFFHQTVATLHLSGDYSIVLGQKSAALLSDRQRALLEKRTDQYSLGLSSREVAGQGGFILEQYPVEYSFLYSDLLTEIKKQEMPNLLKRLLA